MREVFFWGENIIFLVDQPFEGEETTKSWADGRPSALSGRGCSDRQGTLILRHGINVSPAKPESLRRETT